MSTERGSAMLDMLSGGYLPKVSSSLNRCPRGIDRIRMKALGQIGVNYHAEYYGDEMTWTEFESIGIIHGNSTIVKYPQLNAGWTYYYDAVGGIFTVTNDKGNVTVEKIHTLSDMGIVWEILSSHQFKIYFSAKFIDDAFLIAWIKRRGSDYDPTNPKDDMSISQGYKLAYVDQYFNETLHNRCDRIVQSESEPVNLKNTVTQSLQEPIEIHDLRSNTPMRNATGDYTAMAIKGPDNIFSLATKQRNAAIDLVLGEFMMVAFFASIMNMSKPVYEPWMLWSLWKWLGSGSITESVERIFDLSPRW